MATTISTYVTKFSDELDKELIQKSVTGFFADNSLSAKFVGAKSVSIPRIALDGLGDYARNGGFVDGDLTVTRETHTLSMDRGRSFQIDRMDEDEAGVAGLIAETSGELVRTQVAPEMDAYVLSKLYGYASTNSHLVTVGGSSTLSADIYSMFSTARNAIEEAMGYNGDEIVMFCNPYTYATLCNSSALSRYIIESDFKKGEVSTKVKTIDGVAIIPVADARMKTAFTFYDGTTSGEEAGGFVPTGTLGTNHDNIGFLMCPKKLGGLVKKTEKLRVFAPDTNQQADAYKVDYRVYYDFFVNYNKKDTVYAYKYSTEE